ncbi:O-methyltransferase asqD [Lachnellula suecica]|uniref:O-methyltransferase asqD n=1 Tax=Lachnellula suecica TaxID=602035 RepID=A0A8T9C328_9HELO|nr:O-methyltransferase asqD [Lachnellula suecica]
MDTRPKHLELISEIQTLLTRNDAASRKHAAARSRALTTALETPEETAVQISFMVLCTRLAIDLRLFIIVTEHRSVITAEEVATKSGGEKLLIIRIMRVLSLIGFVDEVAEQQWIATPITIAMTQPAIEGSHKHLWDMTFGTAAKIPEYMHKYGYKSPTSLDGGPLQYAFGTNLTCFEYCSSKPNTLEDFNNMMTGIRHSRPSWVEWFPVYEQLLKGYRDDTILLVDIGGGWGHDVVAFRQKFGPDAKLGLQDLPHVVSQAPLLPSNIEIVGYNFLIDDQPMKGNHNGILQVVSLINLAGARAYFFHFVFHDWPDDKCLQIFRHTASAMKKGYSKILLNEYVLRDFGCSMAPAMMDINMLTLCSGLERSEKQWRELVKKAGLRIVNIWRPEGDTEAVIEIEL